MADRLSLIYNPLLIISILNIILCIVFATSARDREGRIVGGENAQANQFPYMASLQRRSNGNHFCAGSIVSELWVLTAAHCTIDETILSIDVEVGSYLLRRGTMHRIYALR